jgi:hypothetical protein
MMVETVTMRLRRFHIRSLVSGVAFVAVLLAVRVVELNDRATLGLGCVDSDSLPSATPLC